MSDSSIEWTNATWNPVAGCSIISAGCTNCYAMRFAARLEAMGVEKYAGLTRKSGGRAKWTGTVRTDPGALDAPLHWRKPKKIFVNSMSDLFHEGVPEAFIRRVWKTMSRCHWHQFQILTKRPERMQKVLADGYQVLNNVWLGTSVEDSAVINRIDALRDTPAHVRFVSFEPLIGSVGNADLMGIDWAIVGGESGPGSRHMDPVWVDEVKELCERSDTAFFFKQWGGTNKKAAGRLYQGREWNEYPDCQSLVT